MQGIQLIALRVLIMSVVSNNVQFVSSFLSHAITTTRNINIPFTDLSRLNCPSESKSTACCAVANALAPNGSESNVKTALPFFIEELNGYVNPQDSEEISNLIIKVFFEEEAELKSRNDKKNRGNTPWKVMQLAYLKNLQNGDIKGKKFLLNRDTNNSMFVAREVIPCYNTDENIRRRQESKNNIIDATNIEIFNEKSLNSNDVVYNEKGPILGFVDVSEKTFGLPTDKLKDVEQYGDDDSKSPLKLRTKRPVLTNLSVKEEARCSGVGSALVDACENAVMNTWSKSYDEMVLEVEGENILAQKFYEKRDYVALYADPTSRRFDTSGLILKDVRTTKICYKKDLGGNKLKFSDIVGGKSGGLFGIPFFAKIKEVVSKS